MRIRFRALILGVGMLVLLAFHANAQNNSDRITTIQTNLSNARAAFQQLPGEMQKRANSLRRMAQLSNAIDQIAPRLKKGPNANWQPSEGWDQGQADENGLIQVNNPARDLRFSPFTGFTQNNSATARCGDNVVVAFQDTASILETLLTGQGGVSFQTVASGTGGISVIGYATSRDGGETFRDRGAVPPGPDVDTILFENPSVACADANHFYLAVRAALSSGPAGGGHLSPVVGVVVLKSSDGGVTWSDPVTIVEPDTNPADPQFQQDFDAPSIAVDPSNPSQIYVAYTHNNFNAGPPCFLTSAVEVVSSIDGGQTFGNLPMILDSQCFVTGGNFDIGTRMGISSKGRVTVAWENQNILAGFFQVAIESASFTPGGAPTGPVIADLVSQGGAGVFEIQAGFGNFIEDGEIQFEIEALQGGFENQRGFDVAVDHSGGPNDGSIYVVWDDSRNAFQSGVEFEDDFGFYSFTDIRLAVSTDGGQTYAPSTQVNSDVQLAPLHGHDHFRPVAAVDGKGKLAACWYDRRNDPENYQYQRFCAESTNRGATWAEFLVPGSLSTPVTQQDFLLIPTDMGRNDNLTSDFTGHAPGFIGGIQWTSSTMNPDIKEVKFR